VKNRQEERIPTTVPNEARRAGDIRDRWSWVEPSVWTERMLTALENGVKGGKWYSLMDKVCSLGSSDKCVRSQMYGIDLKCKEF